MKHTLIPAAAAALFLAACPQDPFDPETWISDLDDPHDWEDATIELERLGEPEAIEPLVEAWEHHDRPSRILRAIISLADQDGQPARWASIWEEHGGSSGMAGGMTALAERARGDGPYWEDAMPALIRALEDFEAGDDRTRSDAVTAARALGRAGHPDAVSALVNAATQRMPRLAPGQEVRRAAVFALGEFGDSDEAVETLIRILEMDRDDQPIELHGAAAMALGQTRSEDAMQPLLVALFEYPELYQQVRAALTGLGRPVIPELVRIFDHEHEEINALAEEHGYAENCDRAMGPETDCRAPGNIHFRSSSVLGDMRAEEAVGPLAAELQNDPEIAFFEGNRTGPPSHQAILAALSRIGGEDVVRPLRRYWRDSSNMDGLRAFAIDRYSRVAPSGASVGRLIGLMDHDDLGSAAILAVARLASEAPHLEPLDSRIAEARDAAAEKEEEAEAHEEDDEEALAAEARHMAQQERDRQRGYEQHMARALVGFECGDDPGCYADILSEDAEDLTQTLEGVAVDQGLDGFPGVTELERRDQSNLQIAARERALFDLAKLDDPVPPSVLHRVLTIADTTEGLTRDALLLALPQMAEKPCEPCHRRLAEVIDEQEDQSRLNRITADTRIVKHYFAWAGHD